MRSEISALIDDELSSEASDRAVEALNRDLSLRRDWEIYQLIGDTLRRAPVLSSGFTTRVMARLTNEATVFSPASIPARRKNVAHFAFPLAASIMGIGVVGWVALWLNAPEPTQMATVARPAPERVAAMPRPASERLAAAPRQAPKKAAPSPVRPEADAMAQYLLAHQAHSPSGGIQGVAPYVRTVSEIRQDGTR